MSISYEIKVAVKPVYSAIKNIVYDIQDYYDVFTGKKHPLVPPRSMIFIGNGDYLQTGNEFFKYFVELGQLTPSSRILDVGCGIGRMAVPLTEFLSNEGEYHGFDIVEKGIKWCNQNISPKFKNFHFHHANIYNKMYNPKGIYKSSEYRFETKENYFDFVFLTSVFTHMHTEDVAQYLAEISRTMKKGRKCLITFFLLNSESSELIKIGKSTQKLTHKIDDQSYTKDINVPESAIGYNENFIRQLFDKCGLEIKEPIHYGSWCGRRNYMSYQDIIIAEKI